MSKFRVFFYATNIGQAEMEERGVPTDWITGPAQSAGGETHTYLKHLVDHKDDHGDFVWFTEAGRGEIERSSGLDHIFLRLPLLTNATGVLALGEVERHSCSHMKYIEKICAQNPVPGPAPACPPPHCSCASPCGPVSQPSCRLSPHRLL